MAKAAVNLPKPAMQERPSPLREDLIDSVNRRNSGVDKAEEDAVK
jgi:hypothetical protein